MILCAFKVQILNFTFNSFDCEVLTIVRTTMYSTVMMAPSRNKQGRSRRINTQ